MATTTDLNIVLGQGDGIREIHNVRKQVLESNQQFMGQKAEEKQKEEKSKVLDLQTRDKVEISGEGEKKDTKGRDSQKKKGKDERPPSGGNIIDIKV